LFPFGYKYTATSTPSLPLRHWQKSAHKPSFIPSRSLLKPPRAAQIPPREPRFVAPALFYGFHLPSSKRNGRLPPETGPAGWKDTSYSSVLASGRETLGERDPCSDAILPHRRTHKRMRTFLSACLVLLFSTAVLAATDSSIWRMSFSSSNSLNSQIQYITASFRQLYLHTSQGKVSILGMVQIAALCGLVYAEEEAGEQICVIHFFRRFYS
jgi:hypothetical protein